MDNVIRQMANEARVAAQGAVSDMRDMLGQSRNPDLRLYNRLKGPDFEQIRAEQGDDGLMNYVHQMETARLKESGSGRQGFAGGSTPTPTPVPSAVPAPSALPPGLH